MACTSPCRGQSLAMPEAVPANGRVRSFESMWTRKYGFTVHGMYEKMMGELEREDVAGFRNFIRIEPARFY